MINKTGSFSYTAKILGYAQPAVTMHIPYRAMIDELLQEAGVQPHSLIEINNIQAIKKLVMSGLGITVLPRVSVEYELTQNLLTEVPWKGPPLRVFTQIAYY